MGRASVEKVNRRTLIPGGRREEFRLLIASVTKVGKVPSVRRLVIMPWHFSQRSEKRRQASVRVTDSVRHSSVCASTL